MRRNVIHSRCLLGGRLRVGRVPDGPPGSSAAAGEALIPMKDPKHLKALRAMPCAVPTHIGIRTCYPPLDEDVCSGPIDAHHPTGSGLALKASDHDAMPLCHKHHMNFHDARGVFRNWTKEQRRDWQRQMSEKYRPGGDEF